jgi:uncharacterized membrane protein
MVRRRTLSAVFAVATLCWAAIILAVPYALSHDARGTLAPRLAVAVYLTGSFVCHQQDQRSFHPWGVKMPVCARCFGLYASAPLGAALSLAAGVGLLGDRRRRMTTGRVRWLLAVTALPTAVTFTAEWLGLAQPSSLTRFLAALPLGAAVAWVVASAIREEIR